VCNLWPNNAIVREFSFSRRLARLAAELMACAGVRMYHDQALFKEPGGGHTPWHSDQTGWPLSSDRCITAWVPLQQTPREMGPLAFAVGSHRLVNQGRELSIGDESEAWLGRTLADLPKVDHGFDLGEVSFHGGWTFHRAGANTTERMRRVMTVIYMDADMRVAAPTSRNQIHDSNAWMPGIAPGEPAASPLNPVLYP
jgi:ectoine hydroxylase-related dioxygenase (phytanoyl-CoA dioxygenase family)